MSEAEQQLLQIRSKMSQDFVKAVATKDVSLVADHYTKDAVIAGLSPNKWVAGGGDAIARREMPGSSRRAIATGLGKDEEARRYPPRLPPFPKYPCRKRPRVGRRQVFTCSIAEQRSKTELIGNRLGKSYRRATRLRPRMEGRGHQGSGGCTLRPAIHPPRDRFARR